LSGGVIPGVGIGRPAPGRQPLDHPV